MIKLRDYQEECINKILETKNGSKVIINLATGSGKTIIMSGLVNKIYNDGARVMIVVPSTELRLQTIDKLHMVCGNDISIGSVQANINEYDKQVIVATRQSLTNCKSKRIQEIKSCGEFDYIIIDECHQACEQIKKIHDAFDNGYTKFIGCTATPFNEEMKKVYDKIIFTKSILDMISINMLVEPRCKLVYSDTDISNVQSVAGEFNLGQLEECVNNENRNQLIVDAYNKYLIDRNKTLVFATGIDHAKSICECFNKNGIKCYSLDSNDTKEDRDRILDEFKKGKVKVLVNVSILTTGFDVEDLDSIILARPTKSKILYTQIIGRGLRLHPTKKDCMILDVVDVARKHNIMSMNNIFNMDIKDGETPTEAKERIERLAEEEKKRLEEEQRQREEEERKQQELIAQEIELFNSSMKNISLFSSLDWFYNNETTYSLCGNSEVSCTIRKTNDNEFTVYSGKKNGYNLILNEDYITNNLQDAIQYSESMMLQYGTSYLKKYVQWKFDKATQRQIDCIKKRKGNFNIKTKWDCHKFFFNTSMYFALKELDKQK